MKKPKPVLLTPRQNVREITSTADADRMLASGSWCRAVITKQPTPDTRNRNRNQRAYLQRRAELGYKRLDVFLPPAVFTALHARRQKGESLARLIARLLKNAG